MSLPKLDLDEHTLEPLGRTFASTASLSLLDASLSARNDYCRFAQEGYAAVRWDGAVSPCLSLLHDHPMYMHGRRKDVTHYTLGNVNERPLDEVWTSPEFSGFRARLRDFPYSPCTTCGGCERFPQQHGGLFRQHFSNVRRLFMGARVCAVPVIHSRRLRPAQ